MDPLALPVRLLVVEPDERIREWYQDTFGRRADVELTLVDDPKRVERREYDVVVIGWLPDFVNTGSPADMRMWRAGYLATELYELGAKLVMGVTDNSPGHREACAYGSFWRNPTQEQVQAWLEQIIDLAIAGHFFDLSEFRG